MFQYELSALEQISGAEVTNGLASAPTISTSSGFDSVNVVKSKLSAILRQHDNGTVSKYTSSGRDPVKRLTEALELPPTSTGEPDRSTGDTAEPLPPTYTRRVSRPKTSPKRKSVIGHFDSIPQKAPEAERPVAASAPMPIPTGSRPRRREIDITPDSPPVERGRTRARGQSSARDRSTTPYMPFEFHDDVTEGTGGLGTPRPIAAPYFPTNRIRSDSADTIRPNQL